MNDKLTPCACMGPIGNDPHCPCVMTSMGLTPTTLWTKEDKMILSKVMSELFKKRADKNENK